MQGKVWRENYANYKKSKDFLSFAVHGDPFFRKTDMMWDILCRLINDKLKRKRAGPNRTGSPDILVVGKAGFEPAASCSRSMRANQAALLPVVIYYSCYTIAVLMSSKNRLF